MMLLERIGHHYSFRRIFKISAFLTFTAISLFMRVNSGHAFCKKIAKILEKTLLFTFLETTYFQLLRAPLTEHYKTPQPLLYEYDTTTPRTKAKSYHKSHSTSVTGSPTASTLPWPANVTTTPLSSSTCLQIKSQPFFFSLACLRLTFESTATAICIGSHSTKRTSFVPSENFHNPNIKCKQTRFIIIVLLER